MIKLINKKTILIATLIVLGVLAAVLLSYTAGRAAFNRYFERRGEKLIELENQGLLSSDFGAAWKNEIATEKMRETAAKISGTDEASDKEDIRIVNGIMVDNFPSISIIRRMNEVDEYSNRIRIADCRDRDIAVIKTDHTRADYEDFPEVLVQALVASEDSEFFTNSRGFEYESFVRASIQAVVESIKTFSLVKPKGTSTITQQVAKYLISKLDKYGMRYVHTTVERKVRELTLASAIRQEYSPEEIMEFYINNCITSDYGLIGAKDIAEGLFDKDIGDLSDAECVYIARMVKWGRNYPDKIYRQAIIDMKRIGVRLGWSGAEREGPEGY
ncbi:MAG: biosynthetic peptidoglycan transglycosylase [Chitinivibrionales bacterium]